MLRITRATTRPRTQRALETFFVSEVLHVNLHFMSQASGAAFLLLRLRDLDSKEGSLHGERRTEGEPREESRKLEAHLRAFAPSFFSRQLVDFAFLFSFRFRF